MSQAGTLQRQTPFQNKKVLIALAIGVVLLMPIPIYISDLIVEKTGMTEQRYLAELPQVEIDRLSGEVKAQEAAQLAHLRTLIGKSEDEIGKDGVAALYMSQLILRDLMGPTKIIRFAPTEKAVIKPHGDIGWDITANLVQWGAKDYVQNYFEATISYRGNGWWKLERLNIPGSRGILRYGVGMKMPTEAIVFHDGAFEQHDEVPANAPAPAPAAQ